MPTWYKRQEAGGRWQEAEGNPDEKISPLCMKIHFSASPRPRVTVSPRLRVSASSQFK
ncbi:MAG: hypothetical protein F6K41_18270 [Symploca sp. SIO3E6]|nr:hypothetical protein [Caldora sp. SIO3E6]